MEHQSAVRLVLAGVPLEGLLAAALAILMVVDVVTGYCAAAITGQLSSAISWRGNAKKAITWGVVVMVAVLNVAAPYPITNIPILASVLSWYCLTESLSVAENAARAGVPLPPGLADALGRVRSDRDAIARDDIAQRKANE